MSALDLPALLTGAVAAAFVTSLLSPILLGRHERRARRATLLDAVAVLERTRWASADKADFRQAVATVRTQALVASAPRSLVDRYLVLAHVCRRCSDETWDYDPDEEIRGSIPAPVAELCRAAGEALADAMWHPWIELLRRGRRKDALDRRLEDVRAAGVRNAFGEPVRLEALIPF